MDTFATDKVDLASELAKSQPRDGCVCYGYLIQKIVLLDESLGIGAATFDAHDSTAEDHFEIRLHPHPWMLSLPLRSSLLSLHFPGVTMDSRISAPHSSITFSSCPPARRLDKAMAHKQPPFTAILVQLLIHAVQR